MDANDTDRLMAMFRALVVGLSAVMATHPKPHELRTTLATLSEKTAIDHDTQAWLLYHSTLETLKRAIPPD